MSPTRLSGQLIRSSSISASAIVGSISTSSYAITASYATNAGAGAGFPFSGSAIITGSLTVSSSGITMIGSGVTGSVTGSLTGPHSGSTFGTASWAQNVISSSFATTASAATSITFTPSTASYSITASYAMAAGGTQSNVFPYTGSAIISGTLSVTGSTSVTGNVGVGAPTQSIRLYVSGNSSQIADFRFTSNPYVTVGDGTVSTLVGTADAVGATSGYGIGGTVSNSDYYIRTNNVNRLRIQSGGAVGVGSASFMLAQFNVRGTAWLGDPNLPAQLLVASNDAFNTAPVAGVTFVNQYDAGIDAGMGGIKVGKENTTAGDFGSYISLLNRRNGQPVSESLRITSLGQVGIGTITPSATLQVQGNVSASSYTSSLNNQTGFFGTSSWAVSASWAPAAAISSGNFTGTFSGSLTGSLSLLPASNNRIYTSTDIFIEAANNINMVSNAGNIPLRLFSSASAGVGNIAPYNFNVISATRNYLGFYTDWDSVTYRARGTAAGILEFNNGAIRLGSSVGLTPLAQFSPTFGLLVSASGVVFFGPNNRGRVFEDVNDITIEATTGNLNFISSGSTVRFTTQVVGGTGNIIPMNVNTLSTSRTFLGMFADWDGTTYRARGSNASIIEISSGNITFSNNTGLTPLGTFTPSNTLILSSSGNAGIGVNAPVTKLQIQGNVSASSYTSSLNNAVGFFGTSSWAVSASWAPAAGLSGGTTNYIPLWTSGTAQSSSILYQIGGSVGINTITPNRTLSVNGNSNITGSLDVTAGFTAQTKSFKIDHQRLLGKSLIYGVLEGPEHAVFARGRLTGTHVIVLPEEWEWLVDEDSITVQLTPIGASQHLYVETIEDNCVIIRNHLGTTDIDCYYLIHATRKDVPQLVTVE